MNKYYHITNNINYFHLIMTEYEGKNEMQGKM